MICAEVAHIAVMINGAASTGSTEGVGVTGKISPADSVLGESVGSAAKNGGAADVTGKKSPAESGISENVDSVAKNGATVNDTK